MHNNSSIFTLREARANNIGIPSDIEAPIQDTFTCKYCGDEIDYPCTVIFGKVIAVRKTVRCTCKQATEEYNREEAEKKRIEQLQEEAKAKHNLDKRIQKSNIGKRYKDCRLNNFICNTKHQSDVVSIAQRYCDVFEKLKENGIGLYIYGTIGAGKTHIATAICHEVMAQGHNTLFTTSNDLLLKIQSTYKSQSKVEDVISDYKQVCLLVIDDLGKEKPTEWALSTLFNILNYRYSQCLPTIITSNFSQDALVDRLAINDSIITIKAIVDRLKESTYSLTLNGGSYRSKQNKIAVEH